MSRWIHRIVVGVAAGAASLCGTAQPAFALFGLFDCNLFRPAPAPCAPPPQACGVPPVGAPGTIARYIPTTAYRQELVSVPVTTYRPVNCCDPASGMTTTSLRPVQTMVSQVRMVPYTTYRVVSANPCGNVATCNGAVPATRAMYAPTTAYYPASYNQASYGVAPGPVYTPQTSYYAPQTTYYAAQTSYYAQNSCGAPVAAAPSSCASCNSAPAPYYTPAPGRSVPNSSVVPPSIPRSTPVPPASAAPVYPAPSATYTPAPAAPAYSAPATGGAFAPAPATSPAPAGSSFNNTFTPQRPILPTTPSAATGTSGPATTGSSLNPLYNAPAYPPAWSTQQPAPSQLPQYQNGGVLQDREGAPPRSASNLPGRFASQQRPLEGEANYPAQPNYAQPGYAPQAPAAPARPTWPSVDDSGWTPAARAW